MRLRVLQPIFGFLLLLLLPHLILLKLALIGGLHRCAHAAPESAWAGAGILHAGGKGIQEVTYEVFKSIESGDGTARLALRRGSIAALILPAKHLR